MKKKLVSLLLVAAMGVSMLVGCGGGDANKNTQGGSSNPSQNEGVTDVKLTVWGPENQQDLFQTQSKAFAEANKDKWNITWEFGVVGEDTARDQVLNDADAAADVFMYASDNTPTLVDAQVIAKLGGETKTMIEDTMDKNVIDTVTIDGDIYAVPFTHNTYFMYYDKTIFTEEDVKTMEGIVNKATPDGVYNFKLEGSGWYMGTWYYSNGLSLYGMDGKNIEAGCNWNNETGVAVTNYLIDLVKNPKVSDTVTVTELAEEHKVGAWFDGAWNYKTYKDILGDDLGMAIIPTMNINGQDVQLKSFYSTKAIGVNTKSDCLPAAIAFAAFLGSEAQQTARFEASAQVPTNTVAAAAEAVTSSDIAKVILDEFEKASIVQPTSSEFGSGYWTPSGAIVNDIKQGKLTKDNVQEYLNTLVKAMTEVQ